MTTTRKATTTAARLARIERALDAILAERTSAPATAAPAQAKAKAPFVQFLEARAASKIPCEIHPAGTCNRAFTPASSGRTNHVARVA